MEESKPANIQIRKLRGQWTEASAYQAVRSWLQLPTSRTAKLDLIAAQDDSMALGARRAFEEISAKERERWLKLPFLGCDGLPKTGQAAVNRGLLRATVVIPTNAGLAVEMLVQAIRNGAHPAEHTFRAPDAYPPLSALGSSLVQETSAGAE
jgi:ribose transport system substrate-binding protein